MHLTLRAVLLLQNCIFYFMMYLYSLEAQVAPGPSDGVQCRKAAASIQRTAQHAVERIRSPGRRPSRQSASAAGSQGATCAPSPSRKRATPGLSSMVRASRDRPNSRARLACGATCNGPGSWRAPRMIVSALGPISLAMNRVLGSPRTLGHPPGAGSRRPAPQAATCRPPPCTVPVARRPPSRTSHPRRRRHSRPWPRSSRVRGRTPGRA